jgi:hypothetical protein
MSDWKAHPFQQKELQRRVQDLIPIHIIPRDKYIYRAKRVRERDGRNARGMRTMRGIQPPVSGVKLKNNKRKEKGISRAADAAAPGPHAMNHPGHCAPRITPPTPRIFPNCSRRPPHLPRVSQCWENAPRSFGRERKFLARARGWRDFLTQRKTIKSQTEEIARRGFPYAQCMYNAPFLLHDLLRGKKMSCMCARALGGNYILPCRYLMSARLWQFRLVRVKSVRALTENLTRTQPWGLPEKVCGVHAKSAKSPS